MVVTQSIVRVNKEKNEFEAKAGVNKDLPKLSPPVKSSFSHFAQSIGNLCLMEPTNLCKPCSLPRHSFVAKDLGTKSLEKFNWGCCVAERSGFTSC